MKVEKYQIKSESSLTTFEFISEVSKGLILKRIEFQRTTDPRLFNLAFGDKNLITGEINDEVVLNNGDSEKVLATVIGAAYSFFDQHPNTFVYAKDSTKSRTMRCVVFGGQSSCLDDVKIIVLFKVIGAFIV